MCKGKYYFWIDPELKRHLADHCAEEKLIQSQVVEEAIAMYLRSRRDEGVVDARSSAVETELV